MDLNTITETLMSPRFEAQLREAFATSNMNPQPDAVERTIEWIKTLRHDLLALLKEVDDDEQIEQTMAINYVELKSRWIAINTKVNYQMFRTGQFDVETALRGTSASMFLAEVEALLDPRDIAAITEFLAQPLRRAA